MTSMQTQALRELVDRSVVTGTILRRLRRQIDRSRNGAARRENIAMLHAGRCGSSVVADLLHQRPDFVWAGELFENMAPIYYRMDSRFRARELIANALYRDRVPYFGFDSKYLPEQHLRPELANLTIERYIALLRELGFGRFILVGRRNHLRRAASVAVGTKTGQWNTLQEVKQATVRLDPERFLSYQTTMPLLDYFRSLDEAHGRVRQALGGLSMLELEYESDIERDPLIAYRKVCVWMGLPATRVTVRLKKINARSLADMLENLPEVERALRGTPYEWMIEARSPGPEVSR